MGVSKNRGTLKWMVKIMENPYEKMDDFLVKPTIFEKTSTWNPWLSFFHPPWPSRAPPSWRYHALTSGVDINSGDGSINSGDGSINSGDGYINHGIGLIWWVYHRQFAGKISTSHIIHRNYKDVKESGHLKYPLVKKYGRNPSIHLWKLNFWWVLKKSCTNSKKKVVVLSVFIPQSTGFSFYFPWSVRFKKGINMRQSSGSVPPKSSISWWFQPIRKIWSSNWIIAPNSFEIKKCFKPPPSHCRP